MSYSIDNLSFTIWGNGHDATLMDSGDGDARVFSHPFVPLNSLMYAGQWYFIVPDEQGNSVDAVKDDISHCTFSPAIGSTFDTEGAIEVTCHYHREYIYPEETIIVDKTVKQTIEVVDHGTVSSSQTRCDVYSDGYLFYHPSTVNTAISEAMYCSSATGATKVSSIPWRVTALGKYGQFAYTSQLVDINELQYADTSNVTEINELFHGAKFQNLDPLAGWDTHNVTKIYRLAYDCPNLSDISGVAKWDVSNVTDMQGLMGTLPSLKNLHGVEDWDVRKVTTLWSAFWNLGLTDISAVANWNPEALQDIRYIFARNTYLQSLSPLSGWTPILYQIENAFEDCASLVNYEGVENFDVSNVTSFKQAFKNNKKCVDISAVAGWDVSNGITFTEMFEHNYWNTSIHAIESWVFKTGAILDRMFHENIAILTVDDATLDISNCAGTVNMLMESELKYSSLLGEDVFTDGSHWYDYNGLITQPVTDLDHPLVTYTKDASNAENWIVSGTNLQVFNSYWSNIPSWN